MKSESVKTRHAPKNDRDIDVETKAGEVIESFVDDTDELIRRDPAPTLMELAKDPRTPAAVFLAAARENPDQLQEREELNLIHHHHHHHNLQNAGKSPDGRRTLPRIASWEVKGVKSENEDDDDKNNDKDDENEEDDDDDDDEEEDEDEEEDCDGSGGGGGDEEEENEEENEGEGDYEYCDTRTLERPTPVVASHVPTSPPTEGSISPTSTLSSSGHEHGYIPSWTDLTSSSARRSPTNGSSTAAMVSGAMKGSMAGLGAAAGMMEAGLWRRGGRKKKEQKEFDVSPVHYLMTRCTDLSGEVIVALHLLDDRVLSSITSLRRTPIHHMLQWRQGLLRDDVIVAIQGCYEDAFTEVDSLDHTPLDRYFRHNHGVMDVTRDDLVNALCRVGDAWGLDALVKSKAGYRKPYLLSRELRRFRVLTEGNPFEVETFVKSVMHSNEHDMLAQLKFMFVVLPLRSPSKFGMSSSMGLNFFTKILTTVVDVYAEEKDPKLKRLWMNAFADAALSLIIDENLLSGMFLDPPSVTSVEALASTEFLSAILNYKFNAGPVLIFGLELTLFSLLFALLTFQILAPEPSLYYVIVACIITGYFTVREFAQMYTLRREELKSYATELEKGRELQNATIGTPLQTAASLNGASAPSSIKGAPVNSKLRGHEMLNVEDTTQLVSPTTQLPGHEAADEVSKENATVSQLERHFTRGPVDATMLGGRHPSRRLNRGTSMHATGYIQIPEHRANDLRHAHVCFIWRLFGKINEENLNYILTTYLFMPVSWRSDPFNWVDLGTLMTCWVTEAFLLHHAIDLIVSSSEDDGSVSYNLYSGEYSIRVLCIATLWMKFFGFLKGTSMKMATFILMIQEISVNVDSFIFVLALILLMFTMMYHVLLRDENSKTRDWMDFDASLWQVWTYSFGEFDDTAFQTDSAHVLFSFMMLVVVIIMMNILIAIVSDSYSDAMRRSAPIYWRARVLLIAEYEPLLPKLHDNDFMALMNKKTQDEFKEKQVKPPNTWQYHCLMFQEGLVATALVCGIVFFELIYISTMDDEKGANGMPSPRFWAGLAVSLFFLFEILLRGYTWWHTFHSWTNTAIGGFFTNPFRCLDTALVTVDVIILLITLILDGVSGGKSGSSNAKAAVKLARVVRLARSARWLRGAKMLRSCRFFAKLANQWRRSQRPTRHATMISLERSFKVIEESNTWAGRTVDTASKVNNELERSTSYVISTFTDIQLEAQKKHTAQLSEMTERINVAVAANNLLRKEVNELKDLIIRNHLQNTNHVSGFEDEL